MKRTTVLLGLIIFTTAATAQISQTQGSNGGLLFQDGSSNTLLNITQNGDLEVTGELKGVSTGGGASGLSEVLEQSNVANQTIEFDGSTGVQIGDGSTNAQNSEDIAIGRNSVANYGLPGSTEIALGTDSEASGSESLALGDSATAEASRGVAIGHNATAPNSYEATFGNLNSDNLDVNVTGNATIHGSGGLDMPNGVAIGTGRAPGSDSIVIGNEVGEIVSGSTVVGSKSSTSGSAYQTLVGHDASVAGNFGASAFGTYSEATSNAATALGYSSNATAEGAVAIGQYSEADEDNTVELGSSSQAYDLNVNGGDISVDGNVNVDGTISSSNSDSISYSTGHTAWSSGLSGEEVHRIGVLSGEAVIVDRVSVQMKGGGSNSNLRVDVLDESGSNSITVTGGEVTASSTQFSTGEPVRAEITNSGSSELVGTISLSGKVVNMNEVTTGLQ